MVRPSSLLFLCAVVLIQCAWLYASSPIILKNGHFAEQAPGGAPADWRVDTKAGVVAERRLDEAGQNRYCAVIHLIPGHAEGAFANLSQSLDAIPFRGQRVRLKACLKLNGPKDGTGQLWMRVDGLGGKMGFRDNMEDRPVTATTWTSVEIVGDVALDAERLVMGAMLLNGTGSLWIADVSLEPLGNAPVRVVAPAKPLTSAGMGNLVAFAKAYGYLRFFHPSDQAAAAPWDDLAIEGIQAVEGATSSEDLAHRLQGFFAPYAPTARFLTAGQEPPGARIPPEATQGVHWEHVGVGFGRNGTYSSTRRYAALSDHAEPSADPRTLRCFELGAGVRLQMGTACYVDKENRTLPRQPVRGKLGALPEPTQPAPGNPEDRFTRLAAVVVAWNVIQHFYPNFDLIKVDWQSLLPVTLGQVARDGSPEGYLLTVRRMMACLQDGHAWVSPFWRGSERGPGLALTWVGSDLVICGCGDSLKPVLQPGDLLVSVEGRPTAEWVEALAPTMPSSTPQGLRQLEAKFLLNGPAQPLDLVVRGADGHDRSVRVQRPSPEEVPTEPRPNTLSAELKPGVWYLDLARLKREAVDQVLQKVSDAKVVVLDMRGYPVFGAWQALFSHFTSKPMQTPPFLVPTPTLPDRQGMAFRRSSWDIQPAAPRLKARLIFLTDARTLSQAELLMDFVEFYQLGEIVGEATGGVDGNINPFQVGGLYISWTGMKVPKHDGTPLNGIGILPTVPVARTMAGIREGRDEILDKALALVVRPD